MTGTVIAQSVVADIPGYGKTVWGMSPDQVIAAESPRAIHQLDGQVLIADIRLSDRDFDAMLAFDQRAGQSLRRVTVVGRAKTESENLVVFSDVEAQLTSVYGSASHSRDLQDGVESTHAVWTLPSTRIDAVHQFASDTGYSSVSVVYTPNLGAN